ncbi:MAG TPA: hypothetical protein VGC38_01800 [Pseudolabrys sp.]
MARTLRDAGRSLAALTGLLFVAISIRIDEIRQMPHWRIRAFGNTFALIGLLIEASVMLVPQSHIFMGAEIVAINLFLLLYVPVRAFVHLSRLDVKMPTLRLLCGMIAWIAGGLGGASLIAETGGGLYLVTASCLSLIWICTLNAWSFMTVEAGKRPRRR